MIRKILYLGLVLFLIQTFSSCHAEIDSGAANSIAAILAVLGEYFFATLALLLTFILKLIRPLSVATILLGLLGLLNVIDISISPIWLIIIGVVLMISFIIPIKPYFPKVIISKNIKTLEEVLKDDNDARSKRTRSADVLLGIIVGFILLILEYTLFA